jgi:hypothetical protein
LLQIGGSVCEPNAPATSEMPPAGFEDHMECSDWLRKFSTLHDPSAAYQERVLTRSDRSGRVLTMELSRFYHGTLPKATLTFVNGGSSGDETALPKKQASHTFVRAFLTSQKGL